MAKAKQKEEVMFDFVEEETKPKKTVAKKAPVKKVVEPKEEIVEEEIVEEVPVEKPKTIRNVKSSKFNETDLIPCKSMTSGGLNFIGNSGKKVRFEDFGMVEYVEYGDLRREAQSANPTNYLYYPRFIVLDPDFVEEFPKLEELYNTIYTENGDFERIIDLPKDEMKEAIDKLPKGCKECLKGIVATKLDNGSLDSVSKIKMLDEAFGTQMLLMLANN